jgi:hypothetical protein
MSLADILIKGSYKCVAEEAAGLILSSEACASEAVALVLNSSLPINWRAARALEFAARKSDGILLLTEQMILCKIESLGEQSVRSILRMFAECKQPISDYAGGLLVCKCFSLLEKPCTPVSLLSYSVKILEKISKSGSPELLDELVAVSELREALGAGNLNRFIRKNNSKKRKL